LPPQLTEALVSPEITVVRCRLGSATPPATANAVTTSPGDGLSQQLFALPLVIATLVTCVRSELPVMTMYTWLSCETQRVIVNA
jgi:hypothetical protein